MLDRQEAYQQLQLLTNVLQSINDSGSNDPDTDIVYSQLNQNLELLNDRMIEVLKTVVFMEVDKHSQKSFFIALVVFGNLIQQFPFGDRALHIELSIICYEIALQVFTIEEDPKNWANIQNSLGNAYSNRIKRDRADNLERSIQYYNSALKVQIKYDLVRWATTQNNLSNAYLNRIKEDPADNIEYSIECCMLALSVLTKANYIEWAKTQSNLGNSFYKRIEGHKKENLERSIDYYKAAMEIYIEKGLRIDLAMTQRNLANSYSEIESDKSENLERAIHYSEAALEVIIEKDFSIEWSKIQYNIGTYYQVRRKGNQKQNHEKAINSYEKALTILTVSKFPEKCRDAARSLADLQSRIGNWEQAAQSYQTAMDAAEILYQNCIFLYSKAAALRENDYLPLCTAYAYAKTGDFHKSVLAIEIGRVRGLSESLQRDRANLQELAKTKPELVDRYKDTTQQLRNIEAQQRQPQTNEQLQSITTEEQRNIATNLREKFKEATEQIRQQPGYENFLLPPTIEDIFAIAQPHQPIIYLIPTHKGSLALIVMPQEIIPVWIDDFTEINLQQLAKHWLGTYEANNHSAWQQEIDRGTQILWQVMEPIVDYLKSHNFQQAILIPTGLFSLFPLHAAWKEDPLTITKRHYALDSICFSYAPNARSITECRTIADRVTPDTLLAIDNPTQDLASSEKEVQAAISTFPNSIVLRHQEATRQATLTALSNTNVWHCSCHGSVNFQSPLDSGLNMAGEGAESILTLRDILALQLTSQGTGGIRLTVLSACETGLSGIRDIEEVISLPSGLLQAGVAGVVASLWSVGDLSTMILLSRFYALWQTKKMEPSMALRSAQQWLRDAEPNDIIEHCSSFIPDLDRQKELICDLSLDYSDPYHWAAFSYTGV